jgi:hypothetical protein
VPLFGGHRGYKRREDGLVPGSPEAIEADRKKDRERKARAAAAKKAVVEPAPLPSASPGALGPVPPAGHSLAAAPVGEVAPAVPWLPEMLKPLTDELIDAAEERRVGKFTELAREAKLSEKIVKEIGSDSEFPAVAKKGLSLSLPKVVSKWLNKLGISAENEPEITLTSSLVAIWLQGRKLEERLVKLAETAKANPPPAAPQPGTSHP